MTLDGHWALERALASGVAILRTWAFNRIVLSETVVAKAIERRW
jgi:hypothetical protein